MNELLRKIIMEDSKKKEERKFKLEEKNGRQTLVLIDGYGNEVARHGLDAYSDCSTCTYYCGQCVCNCPLVG